MTRLSNARWLWLIPVALALAANLNVLKNGYGWDDEKIIDGIKNRGWLSVVSPPANPARASKTRTTYYRPLIGASYKADFLIWGRNPFGFHFSVWLVHGLNTLLVFFLARGLIDSSGKTSDARRETSHLSPLTSHNSISLIAASLFAVHPAHAEAVAWIAGRNDVFCTLFLLVSLLLFVHSRRLGSWSLYALSVMSYFLALMSKEAALFFFVMFPIYDYLRPGDPGDALRPRRLDQYASGFLPALLIFGLFLAIRSGAKGSVLAGIPMESVFSPASIAKAVAAFGYYLRLMILPYPHRPFIATLPSSGVFIGVSALALVLLAAVFVKALIRRDVLTGISLAWIGVLLAPAVALALLEVTPTEAAERYVYGPSVGALFLAVGWIAGIFEGVPAAGPPGRPARPVLKWTAAFLTAALVVSWGLESRDRNRVWSSPLSFWRAATADRPDSGFPYRELGLRYELAGQYDPAEQSYLRALETERRAQPGNPLETADTLNNLGNLKQEEGKLKEAAEYYERAVLIREAVLGPNNPDVAQTLNNMGALYERMGNPDAADKNYRRALEIRERALGPNDPDLAQTLNNLGSLYYTHGRTEDAEDFYKRAVRIYESRPDSPDLAHALYNLGALYDTRGDFARAEPLYLRSLSILRKARGWHAPALATILDSYSKMLLNMDRAREADDARRRAAEYRNSRPEQGVESGE